MTTPNQLATPTQPFTHDIWMESAGIPIHRGYFVEDLRTVELGWWKEREHNACFVQLEGMKGISEVRVTEIPPGGTLPPLKLAFDEMVYVLQGTGLTSIWPGDGKKRSFEWAPRSLFILPRHYTHQLSNARGDAPVRLMHYNRLPPAMSVVNSPGFFFNNAYEDPQQPEGDLYAEARAVRFGQDDNDDPFLWFGNFFPDLAAWDRLAPYQHRGAGGHSIHFRIPNTEMRGHMSVFQARLYKKAHRHGPGTAIVIPAGEGYSIMWPEGQEKVIVPWHEGSFFVPPGRWFHQHFNAGASHARYLALNPIVQVRPEMSETVENRARDQIEYPDEEPWIRQKFEEELAKRGTTPLMPEEAYRDRDYKWKPAAVYQAVTPVA
jgi:quercetin dioxygenase-like cupin family protein